MEVGCGAGNAVFPLLADIRDPRLFVYACDYSKTAINVVKANEAYDETRCKAFVWDLSSADLPEGVEPASVDIMLMIFVFSALHPDQWAQAVENAYRVLKPGGILLFRDYGRNDLTQLRFKKSRLLDSNFYVRGDGTRVYFFTNDELAEVFGGRFTVEQNAIDRRLLVNRKLELKMYRVWLQAKFRKPINAD
ncbi:S-adenosyl-L-methionine-dependent methyltransferase [Kickxella alabastrina]|uniref:S-adenosyl-L-methionine-dependent methyltransferase n=1 Tax=Kickxella alabastrina TaxID=61397 RepID=UPI00221F133C|nr:S-adenosyl-L-methionine-dependent methyltransferase [Kickxella alabastrina]KAI7835004.1 S-adenosyl-L-methionine-dependent methyltransferase [Kickxella alabastrina]